MDPETRTEITMVADSDVVRPRSPKAVAYLNERGQADTVFLVSCAASAPASEGLRRFRRAHDAGQRGDLPLDDPDFLRRRLDGLDG